MKKIILALVASVMLLSGCNGKKEGKSKSVAVFVPGIMADSPIYAKLAEGVQKSIDEFNSGKSEESKVSVYIMEAGTNQAEWSPKIVSLCATGKYDVIISSNPSLPDLVAPISVQFPEQKFILLDAEMEGNKNVFSMSYDYTDEAYLTGYIAGLMSKNHKVALIAAQEYPLMNNVLYPNFEKGAKDSYAGTECSFRVVGNWYDASKGLEISDSLINSGVDVILPICGGASQGVITSAVNNGTYVCWLDSNGFSKAPGTVISSTQILQDEIAANVTKDYLKDVTNWGTCKTVSLKDGAVEYIENDPLYISTVPEEIRNKMHAVLENIK